MQYNLKMPATVRRFRLRSPDLEARWFNVTPSPLVQLKTLNGHFDFHISPDRVIKARRSKDVTFRALQVQTSKHEHLCCNLLGASVGESPFTWTICGEKMWVSVTMEGVFLSAYAAARAVIERENRSIIVDTDPQYCSNYAYLPQQDHQL